jgi:hypothetical protein
VSPRWYSPDAGGILHPLAFVATSVDEVEYYFGNFGRRLFIIVIIEILVILFVVILIIICRHIVESSQTGQSGSLLNRR